MRFFKRDSTKTTDNPSEENPGHPPPEYKEVAPASNEQINEAVASLPALRTFMIEYDSGNNPKRFAVVEETGAQPLYWAKLNMTKMMGGAHMEFMSTQNNSQVGLASFHKLGTPKIELALHGVPMTMNGYFGTTYSQLRFPSPDLNQQLVWKQPKRDLNLVCLDQSENILAMLHFGQSTKVRGTMEIFDPKVAQESRLLEEILVSGMSYIHLKLYMPSYVGGASSIGVGAGGGGA